MSGEVEWPSLASTSGGIEVELGNVLGVDEGVFCRGRMDCTFALLPLLDELIGDGMADGCQSEDSLPVARAA